MERPLPVLSGYTVDLDVNPDTGSFAHKVEAPVSADLSLARGRAQSFDNKGEAAPF